MKENSAIDPFPLVDGEETLGRNRRLGLKTERPPEPTRPFRSRRDGEVLSTGKGLRKLTLD